MRLSNGMSFARHRTICLTPRSWLATILAMPKRLRFAIVVDEQVASHLTAIERQDHTLILDAIEQQLAYEPSQPTRNRKALRIPNALNATWELRAGSHNRYRVFYDVDVDNRVVVILAIGRTSGNRLTIGKEEFVL